MSLPPYDAIVLAGGRSSRAGSDKLAWTRDHATLLELAIRAVNSAARIVVVGPEPGSGRYSSRIVFRREHPPFGGPVAAIAAALDDLTNDVTLVIAGDLPAARPAIAALRSALDQAADVAVLRDAEGVRQPLLAAYRTTWLREQVAHAPAGAAARSLLSGARCVEVEDVWSAAQDIDTAADGQALGFRTAITTTRSGTAPMPPREPIDPPSGLQVPPLSDVPPGAELEYMVVQLGMSYQEVAEALFEATGKPVSPSSVSLALSLAAVRNAPGRRYGYCIPWRVREKHRTEYPVRMLRLLGLRLDGNVMDEDLDARLDYWLEMLRRKQVVVAYCPEHLSRGFHYIDEKYGTKTAEYDGIPIRYQELHEDEVGDLPER
jgi:molybdopterin-guanine dinucleotide biosynthesis protein A